MMDSPRVVVVGAGPGGIATAAMVIRRGFSCAVLNRSLERVRPIVERGGVEVEGELEHGFVALPVVTDQPGDVLHDAQLVLIALPAYAQRPAVEAYLPHLRPDMTLVFLSGAGATLEVAAVLREAGLLTDELVLAETATLPVSARMLAPTRIRVKLRTRMRGAALPATNTARFVDVTTGMLDITKTSSVLHPALNNPNFLIHPAPMLLNYAAAERANGELSLINEGMTDGVLQLLDAVDAEKQALQQALGLQVLSIDDFYEDAGSSANVYRKAGENFGKGFKDKVWPRYVTEDVPYGTVLYSEFGRLLGVPTPICDGINHIFSAIKQDDYWTKGRTLDRMGIADMTPQQLLDYVHTSALLDGERQGRAATDL